MYDRHGEYYDARGPGFAPEIRLGIAGVLGTCMSTWKDVQLSVPTQPAMQCDLKDQDVTGVGPSATLLAIIRASRRLAEEGSSALMELHAIAFLDFPKQTISREIAQLLMR